MGSASVFGRFARVTAFRSQLRPPVLRIAVLGVELGRGFEGAVADVAAVDQEAVLAAGTKLPLMEELDEADTAEDSRPPSRLYWVIVLRTSVKNQRDF